jgi:hypothetical protein
MKAVVKHEAAANRVGNVNKFHLIIQQIIPGLDWIHDRTPKRCTSDLSPGSRISIRSSLLRRADWPSSIFSILIVLVV